MAFVDLSLNVLVLKVVVTGPPATGKTTRLKQIGEVGRYQEYGSRTAGISQMASLSLPAEGTLRPVEIELYEWHGPERADVRAKSLFTGLDGLIYFADARADRKRDTEAVFGYLLDQAGKSRVARLPGLLVLGRMDDGELRLASFEKRLVGPTWSQQLELAVGDRDPFVEAVRLFGEIMLARVL